MLFFNSKVTESRREILIMGQQWWLFPAITIALTILAFAVWLLWHRYRHRIHLNTFGVDRLITDIEHTGEESSNEPAA